MEAHVGKKLRPVVMIKEFGINASAGENLKKSGTLWSKIEKKTEKIAIESFTFP